MQIEGLFAALLTPRHADHSVDVESLVKLLRFQNDVGITSFALNGATGDFCLTTPDQLRAILSTANAVVQRKKRILCGVGGPSLARTLELVSIAEEFTADGLLLPMPYFFSYAQEDLEAFCHKVAGSTSLPILLYNLPQFTTGLEIDTVARLISEVPNIVGIKDSSGSLDILRYLGDHHINASRMIGNDSALEQAMREGICDGVVSGVACALPELMRTAFAEKPGSAKFDDVFRLLDEFIEHLNVFPTPWGLKFCVEERGIAPATFPLPLTEHRSAQFTEAAQWFRQWHPHVLRQLPQTTIPS